MGTEGGRRRGRSAALGGIIAFLSSAGTSEDWTLAEVYGGQDWWERWAWPKSVLSAVNAGFNQFPPSGTIISAVTETKKMFDQA